MDIIFFEFSHVSVIHPTSVIILLFISHRCNTDSWLNDSKTITTSRNCYQDAVCFAMTKEISAVNMMDDIYIYCQGEHNSLNTMYLFVNYNIFRPF
jgi:hypothetical protein